MKQLLQRFDTGEVRVVAFSVPLRGRDIVKVSACS
jgi:hypothetical protein